jgi:uncharacterized membrane protein YphA (DoxX/SURF4 family)
MRPLAVAGRALLGVPFIAGGLSYRRTAAFRTQIARRLGIPAPVHATMVDAGVKLAGGVLLVAGVRPRATSALLAVNLIPTTIGAHPFWEPAEPMERERRRQHFMLNCAVIGGLTAVATSPRAQARTSKR